MTALLTETTRDLTTRLGEELRRREGERLKRQVLRQLVGSADALAGITLAAWKWVRETLEGEGFEGGELARHCRVLLQGIDTGLAGYEQLRALAEVASLTSEAADLKDLELKLPALHEARAQVVEALNLATQTPRPVDEARLAESSAALERGEFVIVDDESLARLRAGGQF